MKCPQCKGSGKVVLLTTVGECDRCFGTGVEGTKLMDGGWVYSAEQSGNKVTIVRGARRRIVVTPDGHVLPGHTAAQAAGTAN